MYIPVDPPFGYVKFLRPPKIRSGFFGWILCGAKKKTDRRRSGKMILQGNVPKVDDFLAEKPVGGGICLYIYIYIHI